MSSEPRRVAIQSFDVVESTNDTILAAGARGEPEGTTHVAREQSRGRGRSNRPWWSPRDSGLWMSILLRPRTPRKRWAAISLVAGAAVRDALRGVGATAVELYWPNDLQIGPKKLGGILCEVRSSPSDAWLALGIGINIDLRGDEDRWRAAPEGLRDRITSLVEGGAPSVQDPLQLALEILKHFWPLYDRFLASESIRGIVGDRLAHRGRGVRVRVDGDSRIDGTIEGLSDEGHLLVRRAAAHGSQPGECGAEAPADRASQPGVLPTREPDLVAILSGNIEYV